MFSSNEKDIVLRDGATVHVRPIRADDAERLLALWSRVSESSRRARFLEPFALTEENAQALVDLDPDRECALVATLGRDESERIVAVARYARAPEDPTEAEMGALVEDEHQRRGIGRALLRELSMVARDHGIRRLTGDALATNVPVLKLLADLGLGYGSSREGKDVVHTTLRVEETDQLLAAVADDESSGARAALARFFRPESIAVVGASRDPSSIGGLVFSNLIHGGFTGAVYPVNRSSPTVQSVAAYRSLDDCPVVPDLVLVCVPARFVGEVVDDAGRLGVRAVCIITAGFAEADEEGVARQRELMRIVRSHGLRVVGPNCMGLANAVADVRMNGTFSTVFPPAGRVSFLSQSGAMGLAVLDHVQKIGLGLGTFVSVGNKVDISGNDLLLYWEDDPQTDVMLLYLESFGNPRTFSRVARRISRKKPIVAVKSGRTQSGVRAASSHTGALAAGDVAVDALFRQTGVIRTETLEELFDVATLLSTQPLPRGSRVAILTNGGGPGILAADACESNGLDVPALSAEIQEKLRSVLAPEAGVSNPIDMIASGGPEHYRQALEILGTADEVDAVIVIFIRPIYVNAEDVALALVDAHAAFPDDTPLISVFMSAKGVPPELAKARIPSYPFPEEAARALGHVVRYAAWRDRPIGRVLRPDNLRIKRARGIVAGALAHAGDGADDPRGSESRGTRRTGRRAGDAPAVWLDTEDAEALLDCYGIPLARSRTVRSAEEGAAAQREIDAPVAVKVAAAIHKTDVGAIRLGLDSPSAVADAIEEMRAGLVEAGLEDNAGAWLVQEMVPRGVEVAVGVSHDPSFGPLVMVGMGGTLVELHKDVSVRITPLTDVDVREMLGSLRMYPLLTGYRGSPAVDVSALKDLIHRVGAMVEDLPEIAELDLNPVFVRESGVVAVDVRLKLAAGS